MKVEYVSTGNLERKAREWLRLIGRNPGRLGQFEFMPESAALLVLDMQDYFLNSTSHAHVPSVPAILPNVKRLISHFRSIGRPVVFTRHSLEAGENPGIMGRWWRDTVREGTKESAIPESLVVGGSDIVIRKTRYSAFKGTALEDLLRELGVDAVVVTGVTTHLCCDSTARDAFMRDFIVFIAIDASATWTEELHISSLRAMADGFAIPVLTDELLASRRK